MFQFPGFAQNPYLIQGLVPHYDNWKPKTACHHTASEFQLSEVGFPIQKSTDQSLFAAPHGLSQRTTSFIASQCQGIHRTPLRHLIALMIDAHPSAEVAHTWCAMGHRRNKTSLLHDLTRTGGQARSHGRERFGHGNGSNADPPHDRTGQITSSRCRTTRRRTRWLNGKTLGFSCGQHPGGARRDRTDDLMLAKHALSQLSYGPFRMHRQRLAALPAMSDDIT